MSEIRIPVFNEEFDLGLFLFITKKKIIWLFLFLGISLGLCYVYLHFKRPLYQASAMVQIKKTNEASRVLNVESLHELDNVAEEIELLRSEVFQQGVLKDLDLTVEYFTKGDVLVSDQYKNTPIRVMVKVDDPEVYGIPIYLNSESIQDDNSVHILYGTATGNHLEKVPLGQWTNVALGSIHITVPDPAILTGTLQSTELFFIANNPERLTAKYSSTISIALANEAANTIMISVTDYNKYKTADIANAMARKFTEYDLLSSAQSANNILQFIEEQIDTVYTRLQSTEKILRSFKNENKIRDVQDLSIKYMERLDMLEDERMRMELDETIAGELESTIMDSNSVKGVYDLIPLLAGSSFGSTVTQMVNRLHTLLLSKEEALYAVKAGNEGIKSLDYQINVQKNLLVKSIAAIKNKLSSRKAGVEAKIKEIESVFYNTPTKEIELEQLQRQFGTDEKFYTLLLEKQAEYQISRAGYVSKNIILGEAVIPMVPISPNRPLIIISAIAVSLVMGIGIIVFSYLTYNEITSLTEVSKYSKAAILGIIPKHGEKISTSQLLVDKKPKSLISEAFRSIRTNLQFISNEPGPKTIAITSTISGEGKTFVTINLGGILAYAGKKVIILDLDLRKPKIHLGFNTINDRGMSTLLIGKDDLQNCIKKSNLSNLDFITAGPIPPNPSELIISPKLDSIIQELKTMYDLILIDNPPVGIVTDGLTNIQKADYPIYILKANFSKRSFLRNVNKLMEENNIKRMSVILNGVNIRSHGYGYGYGYGSEYGYGYGYGYGYYDEDARKKRSRFDKILGWFRK